MRKLEPKKYSINTHIRDITEEQLKAYADSQEMNVTELLNAAVWYCYTENIDLAIWSIKQRRKRRVERKTEQETE